MCLLLQFSRIRVVTRSMERRTSVGNGLAVGGLSGKLRSSSSLGATCSSSHWSKWLMSGTQ